jgi:RHS repeat-associated protein
MYDDRGKKTWEMDLDIYGKVRTFEGSSLSECPFRYQGQYEDEETGLYYNRFRYYSPEEGMYLSQDPIGLAGGNPTLYGYVIDVNGWVDVFGLDCTPKSAQKKIRRGQGPKEITRIDAPESSVPGSQWHAHGKNGGAINLDGSIHDKRPTIFKKNNRMVKTTRMESLNKIFNLIIKKSELKSIDNYLITNNNFFEEIPIFAKYKNLLDLEKVIDKNEIFIFLINVALFILNNLCLINTKNKSKLFLAITFYNIEEEIEEVGYVLPNLFISNDYSHVNFLTPEKKIDIADYPAIGIPISKLCNSNQYIFYKTVTKDKYGDIERIYMVVK